MPLKVVNWVKRLPLHWKVLLGAQAVVTVGLMLQRRDLQVQYHKAKEMQLQERLQREQDEPLQPEIKGEVKEK